MTAQRQSTIGAFAAVTTLFFAWGFITSLIDPLVAAVKGVFSLSDFQAQLSASAFFIAYGLVSLPAAVLVARKRAAPSILIALAMMIVGCLVMLAAANVAVYALVLLGLFILAAGITILQVAANPLAAALGDPKYSHFRLTLSQTFNSLGTFIGPYIGAVLFLEGLEVQEGEVVSEAARANALIGIDIAYFWLAGLIVMLFVFFMLQKKRVDAVAPPIGDPRVGIAETLRDALSSRWALLGGAAIFLYVGAEVAIGTQMALFLNSPEVWGQSDAPGTVGALARFMALDSTPGVSLQEAGKAVSLYWGGAMVGRIIGTALLARVHAATLLTIFTAIAAAMCVYIFGVGGVPAGFIALGIGLFNSIMFPTIFTLTLERSSASAAATSGFLCTCIVGGAVIPPVVGLVSGATGYGFAFVVPAICYVLICLFAISAKRAPIHAIGDGERVVAAGH
ncbi:MFS transporter [Sphingomonas sp. AX6]|uniref:MFS transporter n=1 Tax=Sphingomonas sp. AX6 TaxID=2653171 RepID=UPI0012F34313|nr:MFS transporter [Sphingomonas sp. AX6]VXC59580.1 MFS transporter [Sphingomonas sp. AX6]